MRRFLDPVTTSGHNDSTNEIVELKTRDSEMHFEAPEAQRDAGGQHGGNSSWDVEADGANNKSFFHKEGGGYHDGMGIFCFLANLWPACRSRVSRNFTKRLKDGEEQFPITNGGFTCCTCNVTSPMLVVCLIKIFLLVLSTHKCFSYKT